MKSFKKGWVLYSFTVRILVKSNFAPLFKNFIPKAPKSQFKTTLLNLSAHMPSLVAYIKC